MDRVDDDLSSAVSVVLLVSLRIYTWQSVILTFFTLLVYFLFFKAMLTLDYDGTMRVFMKKSCVDNLLDTATPRGGQLA